MLTPLQKAQIAHANPQLAPVLMLLDSLERELLTKLTPKITQQVISAVKKEISTIKQGPPGPPGIQGRDGIREIVHKPVPGPEGKAGRDADEAGIFNKLCSILEQKLAEQKNQASLLPDTIEKIVSLTLAKLAEQKQTLSIDSIDGLSSALRTINQNIGTLKQRKSEPQKGGSVGGGGGMGNFVTKDFVGDGSTTTFTLDYKVASGGTAIIMLINGQVQEQTTHYSVNGKEVTFTFAPEDGTFIHAWHVRS